MLAVVRVDLSRRQRVTILTQRYPFPELRLASRTWVIQSFRRATEFASTPENFKASPPPSRPLLIALTPRERSNCTAKLRLSR